MHSYTEKKKKLRRFCGVFLAVALVFSISGPFATPPVEAVTQAEINDL